MALSIESLVGNALNSKSHYTVEHMNRVSNMIHELFPLISIEFDIPFHLKDDYSAGAAFHDVGKIAIKNSILNGHGGLTPEEKKSMEQHVLVGANMLDNRDKHGPNNLYYNMALYHQEHWDGTGYLSGIAGIKIPFEARLLSVFDAYDALSSERPYKPALPRDEVRDIITKSRGKYFDPKIVDFFVKLYVKKLV